MARKGICTLTQRPSRGWGERRVPSWLPGPVTQSPLFPAPGGSWALVQGVRGPRFGYLRVLKTRVGSHHFCDTLPSHPRGTKHLGTRPRPHDPVLLQTTPLDSRWLSYVQPSRSKTTVAPGIAPLQAQPRDCWLIWLLLVPGRKSELKLYLGRKCRTAGRTFPAYLLKTIPSKPAVQAQCHPVTH